MTGWRWAAVALGELCVIAYAVGSGFWVQTNSAWYLSLRRPPWQPPDFVFGLIWPYNFLMLGIAVYQLANRLPAIQVAIGIGSFAISVATALLWSYLFYARHEMWSAAWALVATAAITPILLTMVFRTADLLGWLLVPYQIWLVVAASLSLGYARLNS